MLSCTMYVYIYIYMNSHIYTHIDIYIYIYRGLVGGKSACINVLCAGKSRPFSFQRGGKQGGIVTPEEVNILLETVSSDLVFFWNAVGFGIAMGDTLFNHLTWADFIILGAPDEETFKVMTQQLTDAIHDVGLAGKPASSRANLPFWKIPRCGSIA